jgi:hypothetical protein
MEFEAVPVEGCIEHGASGWAARFESANGLSSSSLA